MADSLPKQLEYLQQTLDVLGKVPVDELHECNEDAASLIEQTFRDRVKGLTVKEADEVLEHDCDALKRWLDESAIDSAPGYFIYGWLVMVDGEWLLAEPSAEISAQIIMDPPPGYTMKAEHGSLTITTRGLTCSVIPIDKDVAEFNRDWMKQPRETPGIESDIEVSEVSYGAVTGSKLTYLQRQPVYWKRVDYILDIPGGWTLVTIDGGGKPFDETALEAQFPTLRIESR